MASGDCCFGCGLTFCTSSEEFQQHGVAFTVEFVNRAVGRPLLHAVDDRLLGLRTEFGDCAEIFPPRGYWSGEVFHEVVNSAGTTGEVKQKIWTHHSPTQSRSPTHGRV